MRSTPCELKSYLNLQIVNGIQSTRSGRCRDDAIGHSARSCSDTDHIADNLFGREEKRDPARIAGPQAATRNVRADEESVRYTCQAYPAQAFVTISHGYCGISDLAIRYAHDLARNFHVESSN